MVDDGSPPPKSETFGRPAALAYLFGRIDYERSPRFPYRERNLNLDRMRALLSQLGDPHSAYPIVHVAGTKGKGSTSAMIAGILTAAGFRAGLYTSPHVERIEERVVIDGQPCSESEFADLINTLRPAVDVLDRAASHAEGGDHGPTYFEITTAAAMLHFQRRGVDAAVLEVGLGGRLDSTNVCQPVVSVITSISLDHMKQLGNTLAAIAAEKAGIIKPRVPVVSGVTAAEPAEVIQRTAAERGCQCHQLGREFGLIYRGLEPGVVAGASSGPAPLWQCGLDYVESTAEPPGGYQDLRLGMWGQHQATNAAVAVATIQQLRRQGWVIPAAAIRTGLAQARLPARTELVQWAPAVVIDAAHNAASVQALLDVLDETFPRARRILVFAASRDKDLAGMLPLLLANFDVVILTRYLSNPRYLDPAALRELAEHMQADQPRRRAELIEEPDSGAAWRRVATMAAEDDLVCVTGSFFLAGELRGLAAQQPLRVPRADAADARHALRQGEGT